MCACMCFAFLLCDSGDGTVATEVETFRIEGVRSPKWDSGTEGSESDDVM